MDKYDDILAELEFTSKRNKKFDCLVKDFEAQKICYLPFTMFLLKPIQRVINYKLLFERLLIYYGRKHGDYDDTYKIYGLLEELNDVINEKLPMIVSRKLGDFCGCVWRNLGTRDF